MKKSGRSKIYTLCFAASIASFLLYFIIYYLQYAEFNNFSTPIGSLVKTKGCHIPEYDPFSKEIAHLYQERTVYHCRSRPALVKVVNFTYLSVNHEVWSHYSNKEFARCRYRGIYRAADLDKPDDVSTFTDLVYNFTSVIKSDHEFVAVECLNVKNVVAYKEYFPLIKEKRSVEERIKKEAPEHQTDEKLSVLVVGIDSISKLNFLRHFKRTFKLLKALNAIELRGYNKVEDNTIVNMVPLLTGRFLNNSEVQTKNGTFYDNLELIWKRYATHGYRTLFSEDAPTIATFNYKTKGFFNPPTDYYYRPFALALEKSEIHSKSTSHCFNSKLEISVLYDWVQDFAQYFADKSYFAYTFASRLSHDDLNYAGYADIPSHKLLKQLNDTNSLNNTVVIFMSDHGIRFGKIRYSHIGKLEERLPFMFLLFPKWFHEKYPHISQALHANQHRLTTPFDIYKTLKDILYFKNESIVFRHESQISPGYSLFTEIPESRTCEDASIANHWCTCKSLQTVSVSEKYVINAGISIVEAINKKLEKYHDICDILVFKRVLSAQSSSIEQALRRLHNEGVNIPEGKEYPVELLITIEVEPSLASFEVTVLYYPKSERYDVGQEVSRINRYGNQSDCLQISSLSKYCYCKN